LSRIIIIGTGPAAAGAALALAEDTTKDIVVLDIGTRLEDEHGEAAARLSRLPPAEWDAADVGRLTLQPVKASVHGLPEKRAYGSNFPFRDVGQLAGITGGPGVHTSLISPAFGGFSNVWGAQTMPFTSATFGAWPVSRDEMAPHYKAVLGHVPLAGAHDDLEELFPLYVEPAPLPELAPRTTSVLAAYRRHRARLNKLGITVGEARLAFRPSTCVRCNLCMTGCPYGFIYSASQTFDALVRAKRVTHRPGLLALRVTESPAGAAVEAKDVVTGELHRFEADRVLVAAGAVGSTRIVLNSLKRYYEDVELGESVQFSLPVVSARPTPDPRSVSEFTLNQFNMVLKLDAAGLDVSQIHFYPYNPAIAEALPAPLRHRRAEPIARETLKRLSVGLGYLPSWASPAVKVRVTPPGRETDLPELQLAGRRERQLANPMFRRIAARLAAAGPLLDLWPVFPMTSFSAPGKSYHWGGTFPHTARPSDARNSSDPLGRIGNWERIHVVDAAVFPTVPATTFTLTIMANAHRIGTAVRSL
jgi:choline dehydrogenase-like flavoprotein